MKSRAKVVERGLGVIVWYGVYLIWVGMDLGGAWVGSGGMGQEVGGRAGCGGLG